MLEKLNKVKEALDTCNQWDNGMAGRGQEFDEYSIDEAKEAINTIIEELHSNCGCCHKESTIDFDELIEECPSRLKLCEECRVRIYA